MTNPDGGGLTPGLYLVAVPIGNARDITLRALDVLREADVLAAEDTRSLRRLMEIHGIAPGGRPLVAYHDHSSGKVRERLLSEVAAGKAVAYASEAGTPMISDPGFDLVRAAREERLAVTTAPGVSAAVTALSLAALPTDRFLFAGFVPSSSGARKTALRELAQVPATLVFYESPRRLGAFLAAAEDVLGGEREAAVCRELTKKFEEIRRGTLSDLTAHYTENTPKGEIVVLIGKGDSGKIREIDIDQAVTEALKTMSVRDAADTVSARFGVKRRPVYQRAMALADGRETEDGGD